MSKVGLGAKYPKYLNKKIENNYQKNTYSFK